MSCACIIKDIPSVFCNSCGELQCCICSKYIKCDSCSYFSCDDCTLKLWCNHNYCRIDCILKNEKNSCDKKCFFLRDINSTDEKHKGFIYLLDHWKKNVGEDITLNWLLSYKIEDREYKDIDDQNLIDKINKLIVILNS